RRQKALADQRARQERADSKAEGPKPGGAPRAEGARAGGTPAVVDTQKNASDRAARLKQAQERKERAQQREASRKKPPPQPLPPPPP
ncbi:MAG TPA: hypothetical protein VLJ86_09045, partial [Ramlibacter sp.]|nr:hypothetical protein [Ramlibacter sp.]